MTFAEKQKQHAADMEAKLKQLSKDQVLKKGADTQDSGEREATKAFFEAVANPKDVSLAKKSNEIQVKAYEAKSVDWREDREITNKAQTVGTGSQGGLLVPTTLRNSILEKQYYISPMRQIATVISNMPAKLDIPSEGALPTTYWVGEGVAITESGVTVANKQLVPYKLAGLDSFTYESIADTATNPALQDFVTNRFAVALALAENAAFVSGDGSSKPFGFRSSDITPTTVTGNTTAGNLAFGDLLRQMFTLPTAYRGQAIWVTSSAGLALIWGLKDTQGRPLYLPGLTAGAPDTFLNRPIFVIDEIPANLGAGTNETELWFGDFKDYFIGDRGGMRTDWGTNGTDFAQDKLSLRMIERVAGRPYLDVAWTKMNIK